MSLRKLTVTAMLSAVAAVLMFLDFSVPLVPSFLKMDLSELPALIASFALGPVWGAAVCLIKNLFNLLRTSTGGIGELSNFILGASFVLSAGLCYKKIGGRRGALIGSLLGAVVMAVISIFSNYFLVYPVYSALLAPMDVIMGMYQAINPRVQTLWQALIWFNMPFTLVKGLLTAALTFLLYKRLSPILKGKKR